MAADTQTSIRFFYIDKTRNLPRIYGIGWENKVAGDHYDWDCTLRKDAHCVFQYTVSGEGEIEMDGQTHRLLPGQAFLIEVPGPYRYKLSKKSSHWEFKFISLSIDALQIWRQITNSCGNVIDLGLNHAVLSDWERIYRISVSEEIKDIYDNSTYAYQFLMNLLRSVDERLTRYRMPESVARCVEFLKEAAYRNIGMNDMAHASGVTRFHLTRSFRSALGETPMQYLMKLRIQMALDLLMNTPYTVDQIAKQCGFTCGNYFAKVFRKWTKLSPTEFRHHSEQHEIFIKI
jgi:AraC-like DNA-binding protein